MRVIKNNCLPDPACEVVDDNDSPISEVTGFLRSLLARGCSSHTVTAYAYDLAVFYRFLQEVNLGLETFTAARSFDLLAHLRDRRRGSRGRHPLTPYLVDSRLAPSTINRTLAAISTFYEYLILTEQAGIDDNPLDTGGDYRRHGVPTRPVRRGMRLRRVTRVPRPLTDARVETLLEAATSQRDRAMLLLMLQGGLRSGEVLTLHLKDVEYGRRRVIIRYRLDHPKGARAKSRSERVVDLYEPEALAAISAYVVDERPRDAAAPQLFLVGRANGRGQPLGYSGLAKAFKRICRHAGLDADGVTMHALRHTHATKLWEGGMRELALQRRLGHASLEATRMYTRVSDDGMLEDYRQALSRLERRNR